MSQRFRPDDRVMWHGQEGRVVEVSHSGLHCVELCESGDQIGTVAEYLTAVDSPDAEESMEGLLAVRLGGRRRPGDDDDRRMDNHSEPNKTVLQSDHAER